MVRIGDDLKGVLAGLRQAKQGKDGGDGGVPKSPMTGVF